jgi:DNA repair photolyase
MPPRRTPPELGSPLARTLRGRGAAENPTNRFEKLAVELDPDADEPGDVCDADDPAPIATEFLRDASRSIVARNQSPDVGFDASVNPYRGCEHGCTYCYARPTHELLGLSAGLDFETRILVKPDAPALLRRELASPRWRPEVVALSGVTDCYQPVEAKLRLTRGCLEVLAEFRNPAVVVTKNGLVARDADLLAELARHDAASVLVSVTTLDPELRRALEPRASSPERRLAAIRALHDAGVPVGVLVAPIIPGLNDHEIPAILAAAAEAGAGFAGKVVLRLPHAVAPLFEAWLRRHRPERADHVLARIRDVREGRINDPRFGTRMRGTGEYADQIHALFEVAARRAGLAREGPELSTAAFRRPAVGGQLGLFADE